MVGLLLLQNAAAMAGPFLVMLGIDQGIPPLRDGDAAHADRDRRRASSSPRWSPSTPASAASCILSGRVGQAVLLDLRQRVYAHFQRLSISFHERYTSGRMVARLTSDMDAISELVDGGIEDLVAGRAVGRVDRRRAALARRRRWPLVTLLSFPFLLWLSNWFRHASARAYRRTRETVALVIVHFVESLGGMRAVHAFRREPRNQEIFEARQRRLPRRQPGRQPADRQVRARHQGDRQRDHRGRADLRRATGCSTARIEVGVLAAFLLYLRRFFEPMQELSQFYNALQSATAALEKLVRRAAGGAGRARAARTRVAARRPARGAR